MIFLDNAATTKPSELAINTFDMVSRDYWDNPSSTMREPGMAAKRLLTESRSIIAKWLDCDPDNIFFTSGATEAANWVIKGFDNNSRFRSVILDPMSHPCMYSSCHRISWHKDLEYLTVNDGVIDINVLDYLLDEFSDDYTYTIVCINYVNNETGIAQNMLEISDVVHRYPNCFLVLDVTQALGHSLNIEKSILGYDFCFGSAHKFCGLKGVGFLCADTGINVKSLLHGGHQESGHRAGTENVAGIYSMAKQFDYVRSHIVESYRKEQDLYNYLVSNLPDFCHVNYQGVPSIISMRVDGMSGQDVVSKLALQDIYISAGSACSTGEDKPSRVLIESGLSENAARETVRVSLTSDNRKDELDAFLTALRYIKGG